MNPFTELLTLLILSHLVADFMLQRSEWIQQREHKRWASPALYLHGAFHIVLNLLVLWYLDVLSYWYLGAALGLVHIIIDPIKKPVYKRQLLWFLGDQVIHLGLLTAVAYHIHTPEAGAALSDITLPWAEITAFVFLTKPASILISFLLPERPLPKKSLNIDTEKDQRGIMKAGEYIGVLERLLTFIFILQNAWIGIGFLITAKSVFRFSDIQQAKQRAETEYIMIGTLLSFGIAIGLGLFFI